jgi:hypothetical protein
MYYTLLHLTTTYNMTPSYPVPSHSILLCSTYNDVSHGYLLSLLLVIIVQIIVIILVVINFIVIIAITLEGFVGERDRDREGWVKERG